LAKEVFSRCDAADYLKSEEDIAAYLEAVMEEGGDEPAYVARAHGRLFHSPLPRFGGEEHESFRPGR